MAYCCRNQCGHTIRNLQLLRKVSNTWLKAVLVGKNKGLWALEKVLGYNGNYCWMLKGTGILRIALNIQMWQDNTRWWEDTDAWIYAVNVGWLVKGIITKNRVLWAKLIEPKNIVLSTVLQIPPVNSDATWDLQQLWMPSWLEGIEDLTIFENLPG